MLCIVDNLLWIQKTMVIVEDALIWQEMVMCLHIYVVVCKFVLQTWNVLCSLVLYFVHINTETSFYYTVLVVWDSVYWCFVKMHVWPGNHHHALSQAWCSWKWLGGTCTFKQWRYEKSFEYFAGSPSFSDKDFSLYVSY